MTKDVWMDLVTVVMGGPLEDLKVGDKSSGSTLIYVVTKRWQLLDGTQSTNQSILDSCELEGKSEAIILSS